MFNFKTKVICGILNVTPDSFSDGGLYYKKEDAIRRADEIIKEGASWIDIGGQSTRPYSEPISVDEEIKRVIPVIYEVKSKYPSIIVSVDTYYPEVAIEAIKVGVDVINDITGLRDERMIDVVLRYKKPVVIMHMKGKPKDMQINPVYDDVVLEIMNFFREKIDFLKKNNFNDIILDPGIGFGKKLEHNVEIIKNMKKFKSLGYPIMFGPSRKSFIGMITGEKDPKKRLAGTIASCIFCYQYVDIFRVHDVYELKQAFDVFEYLLK